MRYKILIEYDGTNYSGWQIQGNTPSIQEEIEKAIYRITAENTLVYCAGRTDAGVHARGQAAHFDLQNNIMPDDQLRKAINFHLGKQPISILACEEIDNDFHARFSAKERHYRYLILNRPSAPAIDMQRMWHLKYPMNESLMQEAANILLGQHDFTSFRSSQCQASSPIKTINNIDVQKNEDVIEINISAPSFLHHMVRNIVGTLANVGLGKITAQEFKKILESKNRKKAGVTAPACGLYFMQVNY